MVNPIFKNKVNLIAYVVLWFPIMLIQTAIFIFVLDQDPVYAAADSIIFNFLFLLLGLSLWFPCNYISIEKSSALKALGSHTITSVITSGLWIYIGQLITVSIYPEKKEFMYSTLLWRFIIGEMFYAIIVSINYVMIYYNNFRDKMIHESKLNALVKEAELKSLKYQINPHFIFNSLNSISSLTLSNPDKAREMTIKLSSFMRGTLSKNENQLSLLGDEINNIRLYLEIERIRFEDKFEFVEEVDDRCMKAEVPTMLLQPLFENAIKHGVYESTGKVTITLKCKHENDYLRITVENNFDPDAVSKKGEQIGLKNIENRLELIYNEAGLLKTKKSDNKFTALIRIPLTKGR